MLKQANLSFSVTAQANGNETNAIQFSTQDKKTAKLIFTIKEGKTPLNLTDIDGEITLVMQDKSRFVGKAEVTKPLDGVLEYTLTQEQIRHAGRAQGEIILKADDGSSVGGFRFTFTIKKALVDEDLGPVKEFYIQDLEAVKQDVKKKADAAASDINNLKAELETIAGNLEEEYQNKAYTVDEKLADVEATVNNLRENGTGIDAQARQEVEQVSAQLAETSRDILHKRDSIILNSDFEEMPYINSRSSVYSFVAPTTEKQYKNLKSLKIKATNYEASTDTNKDFALILTESLFPNEKLRVTFWVFPTVSNKTMRIRLAYSNGVDVNLGQENQWNKISIVLDLSGATQGANYLYFDLKSSYTVYLSELTVLNENTETQSTAQSFKQVNEKLASQPTIVQNSLGMVNKLIEVAQTYQNQINNIIYGNSYTAYDDSARQVDGKHQMDCSSFVNLIVNGVTFENSRYSGNSDNKGSNLFFKINAYKYRYANNIARYAFEKGYAFYPKSDFSNVQPGDVLFFSWDNVSDGIGDVPEEARKSAFMKIDHVAVFLHKKNEATWATLQQYPGSTSVYKEVDNNYVRQCVLVARFPFANVETAYQDNNLIIDGNVTKSTTTSTDVGVYKLSRPLQKGRYYTMFINGNVDTADGYFTILINNKTVYSDHGRVLPYTGLIAFRFPYLLDDPTETIKISIGAPEGASRDRSATVNWCSLYEGYLLEKKGYEQPLNEKRVNNFPLLSSLVSDLDSNMFPHYQYMIDGNKIMFNLNLPFKTARTGNLALGNLPANTTATTQRIPVNLTDTSNQAINAILQINSSGSVLIIAYDTAVQWKNVLVNGCIFK